MGDDISSGSMTDCHLRSFSDHRRHTQQCRAAPRQKSKQPEPMSSPIKNPASSKLINGNKILKNKGIISMTKVLQRAIEFFIFSKIEIARFELHLCI